MNTEELNKSMGTSWHSYPKIWNVGNSELNTFFDEPVIVEEKVDGSQFSFGVFNGELRARSKGKQLVIDAPEKLFSAAIEVIKRLQPYLRDGWTYRGEYLQKPKHNALAYDRAPKDNIIIFDINDGEESYLPYGAKSIEAQRLGLEVVPKLFEGVINSPEQFLKLMDNISVLGGQKIEGVVCKNYTKFGRDKKVLMAKHVSEAFKEVHNKEWKTSNPRQGDILQILVEKYKNESRWNKAIQHLRERGELTNTPKDIGPLLKEVQADITVECKEDIKEELYKWASGGILRGAIRGLPEWYKEQLVKEQFMQELSDLGQEQDALEPNGYNPLISETGCEWDATQEEEPEVLVTANPEE